jgi:hypothetical protein
MKNSKFVPAKVFLARLSSTEKAKVKVKAKAIIAEVLTLGEMRKAGHLTQAKIGAKLKISQDQVSRLEKRTDILLSTLKKYVAAMGGSVHVMVEIPGKPPVKLADLPRVLGGIERNRRRSPVRAR